MFGGKAYESPFFESMTIISAIAFACKLFANLPLLLLREVLLTIHPFTDRGYVSSNRSSPITLDSYLLSNNHTFLIYPGSFFSRHGHGGAILNNRQLLLEYPRVSDPETITVV